MKNYYQKNLKVLRQSSPALYKTLTASLPVHRSTTQFIAESGNVLVKTAAAECYLHSLYHRERELEYLFSPLPVGVNIIVLFGLGMGYALPYIRQRFPALEHLIIIEPNVDVFKNFLTYHELNSSFQGLGRVSFIVNQAAAETVSMLTELIGGDIYHNPELTAAISYRTLYGEYYQAVQRGLINVVRRTLVNMSTRWATTSKWLTNAWRNHRLDSLEVEAVLSKIMPLPVILVSAGPSLNKNIHLLEEAKGKALVIAVGSAMTILDSHGITPHFRMAFDGNRENRLLFDGVDTAKCPLIYSDALYHEVLPLYRGEKLQMVLNTDYLTQYFRKKQNHKTVLLNSGFSIANIAFDMVCRWGCQPIILMGQDLCYTGNAMHADGSWSDGAGIGREKEQLIRAEDIYGRKVWTDKGYLGMKDLFENLIRDYRVDCVNATEGGLNIAGSRNKPLELLLDEELTAQGDITERINQSIRQAHAAKEQKKGDRWRIMTALEADLDAAQRICTARMEILREVQELQRENRESAAVLQKLTPLQLDEEKLRKLDYYREVIWPFMSDTVQAIRMASSYNGKDPARQAEALFKTYAGEATELQRALYRNQKLLEEYKVAQADPALLLEDCLWLLV